MNAKNVISHFLVLFIFSINCYADKCIDSVEYSDSPVNNGWKYSFKGNSCNIFTSNEPFSLGSKALKACFHPKEYTRIGLQYNFKNNEFGRLIDDDNLIEVSIKFYDLYEKKN